MFGPVLPSPHLKKIPLYSFFAIGFTFGFSKNSFALDRINPVWPLQSTTLSQRRLLKLRISDDGRPLTLFGDCQNGDITLSAMCRRHKHVD
jgi:hypothetical protein